MNQPLQARGGQNIPPIVDFLRPDTPMVGLGQALIPLVTGNNPITAQLPTVRKGLKRIYRVSRDYTAHIGVGLLNYGAKSVDFGLTISPAEGVLPWIAPATTVDPYGTAPGVPGTSFVAESVLGLSLVNPDDQINVNVETAGIVEADNVYCAVSWADVKSASMIDTGKVKLTTSLQTLATGPDGCFVYPGAIYSAGFGLTYRNYDSIDHGVEFWYESADGATTFKLADDAAISLTTESQVSDLIVSGLALLVGLNPGDKLKVKLTEGTADDDVYLQAVLQLNQLGPTGQGGGGAF